jgi:integrase
MTKKRGNGEGSIHKRSDKRWEGRIVVGHKKDGSPILKSVFGKTQKECISNLQKAIELYKDAELTENSKITLGEWLERWLNTYVVFRVRESTLKNYLYQTRLICGILGNKPLHSITTADVQKMYNKLKVSSRTRTNQLKGSELLNTVVRSVHMMLHQAMDVAVREHLIPKNPTNGTTIPKKEAQSIQVLNESELERFKKVIEQDGLWYEFFYTEITTGLRRGEICGLKWQDFNTETSRLHIQRAVTVKKGGGFNIGDTKTTNSDRYILLPPKTAEMPTVEVSDQSKAQSATVSEFKPNFNRRRAGTGCVTMINDHLYEGRYTPTNADGKRIARNVYASTREDCEEKLAELIKTMKTEIAEEKAQRKAESESN